MARRKLNKQQQNRISQLKPDPKWQQGQIIARYGKTVELKDEKKKIIKARIPGKLQGNRPADDICVGDWVYFNPKSGFVESLCTRQTQLTRFMRPVSKASKSAEHHTEEAIYRARGKIVAANVTQLCIIISPKPFIETLTIDEYLLAAEIQGFKPLIISNKHDLPEAESEAYQSYLADYESLGYEIVKLSAKQPPEDNPLIPLLQEETSVFMGTSGVGKSSLLNMLIGDEIAVTGEISEAAALGKHTTTTARLYELPEGGDVIDSPGIREFKLATAGQMDLFRAYADLYAGSRCQYSDCTHREEPSCAVKEALENGEAMQWRYENYLTLYETLVEGKL